MTTQVLPKFRSGYADPFGTGLIAAALPMPLLVIGRTQEIVFVNPAAEQFFDTGAGLLLKQTLSDLLAFDSPLFQLIAQARERNSSAAERDVDVSTPRHGERRGTFALRSPVRPNPIAMSVVRLVGVEGTNLSVVGLDCLDGTPLVDIKPYFASVDAVPEAVVGWSKAEGA